MAKGFIYRFDYRGNSLSVDSEDVAIYYPSISEEGSGYFILINGERFKGENVKEVRKEGAISLCRYS